MGRLFGTDGIRGVANQYPITAELAVKLGRTVASIFKDGSSRPKILIGKDTRLSGDMLEHALASGICSGGADAYLVGVLPTPGVAQLISSEDINAGIMISASHNPFHDNGIKIFHKNGFKLSDEKENEIEALLLEKEKDSFSDNPISDIGRIYKYNDASECYMTFLKNLLEETAPFKNIKIAMDCSNGATYDVAPRLFSDLGACVHTISIDPNGSNINDDCGSEHPGKLLEKVLETGADVGLAFDGDGDRLIAVDEQGDVIRGNQILLICANYMKKRGILKNNLVVSTVMSNVGFGIALETLGINHLTTDVGDRYVLEKMIQTGAVLGGEDSGHLIFLDHHTTGDGLLSALRLISALKAESKKLSELGCLMTVFPQVLMNVEVDKKPDIGTVPEVMRAIGRVESELGKKGRVLVRYSGTQPLCRVMVEGPEMEKTKEYCQYLSDVIKDSIG
ncbi:phosphoglucosamine mutase [Thermodesulfobacteriota bacterium]